MGAPRVGPQQDPPVPSATACLASCSNSTAVAARRAACVHNRRGLEIRVIQGLPCTGLTYKANSFHNPACRAHGNASFM